MSSAKETTNYGSVPTTEGGGTEGAQNTHEPPIKKKSCNDVLFALLFFVHLFFVARAWWIYKPDDNVDQDVDAILEDYSDYFMDRGVWKFVGSIAGAAIALSGIAIIFMTTCSDELLTVSIAMPFVGSTIVIVYGVLVKLMWMWIVGAVGFLAAIVFACMTRNKIDFAAGNLRTALTVIRTNFGLVLFSFFLEIIAFAWTILWFNATASLVSETGWSTFVWFLLSYFWTHQVINNLQHTVVASMIGVWWYKPEDANYWWDDGLNSAICHSITYSFGSICFGSLIASTAQTIKWVQVFFSKSEVGPARCIAATLACLCQCIQSALEYTNKWAFVFVGLYGGPYAKSGVAVLRLFEVRGWDGIVSDHLAGAVMFMMKCAVALVTGLVGWWLVKHDNDIFVGVGIDADSDDIYGFCFGVLIGYIMASIMMELVSSAVNAVIVCFAVSPGVFKKNYPELCDELVASWIKAYPNECSDDFEAAGVEWDPLEGTMPGTKA